MAASRNLKRKDQNVVELNQIEINLDTNPRFQKDNYGKSTDIDETANWIAFLQGIRDTIVNDKGAQTILPIQGYILDNGKVHVVDGHRRVMAYKQLEANGIDIGFIRVDIISKKELSTADLLTRQVRTNSGKNFNEKELVSIFDVLQNEGLTSKEIAARCSQPYNKVTRYLQISCEFASDENLKEKVESDAITISTAMECVRHLKDMPLRKAFFDQTEKPTVNRVIQFAHDNGIEISASVKKSAGIITTKEDVEEAQNMLNNDVNNTISLQSEKQEAKLNNNLPTIDEVVINTNTIETSNKLNAIKEQPTHNFVEFDEEPEQIGKVGINDVKADETTKLYLSIAIDEFLKSIGVDKMLKDNEDGTQKSFDGLIKTDDMDLLIDKLNDVDLNIARLR